MRCEINDHIYILCCREQHSWCLPSWIKRVWWRCVSWSAQDDMLALAFPTKQIYVSGWRGCRWRCRRQGFKSGGCSSRLHSPISVSNLWMFFKETSGESPAVFLETITRCFLTGSRDISSPDIILELWPSYWKEDETLLKWSPAALLNYKSSSMRQVCRLTSSNSSAKPPNL